MSYFDMDHADWVQRQIAPAKRTRTPKQKRSTKGWAGAPDELSDFQRKVFDILGITFNGIYNAPLSWNAVEWGYGRYLGVPIGRRSLSTFDFSELTRLVFLSHEARIRCEIRLHGFGLILLFHSRRAEGALGSRHPNLDEAVAEFRRQMPSNHALIWRPLPEETPA